MKTYADEQAAKQETDSSVYKVIIGDKYVWTTSIEDAMVWIDENKLDNEWSKVVEYKNRLINV